MMTKEQLEDLKQEYALTLAIFNKDYSLYREQEGQEVFFYVKSGNRFVPFSGYSLNDAQMQEVDDHLKQTFHLIEKVAQ
ncbi:hypothetical protein [Paraburkholderia aromaticivorans]|uniref:hypothetical protein n=1 Tax=Paraburkholderia aromaticivorans TaxID=2026199 RepID=UPI0038BD912C